MTSGYLKLLNFHRASARIGRCPIPAQFTGFLDRTVRSLFAWPGRVSHASGARPDQITW